MSVEIAGDRGKGWLLPTPEEGETDDRLNCGILYELITLLVNGTDILFICPSSTPSSAKHPRVVASYPHRWTSRHRLSIFLYPRSSNSQFHLQTGTKGRPSLLEASRPPPSPLVDKGKFFPGVLIGRIFASRFHCARRRMRSVGDRLRFFFLFFFFLTCNHRLLN